MNSEIKKIREQADKMEKEFVFPNPRIIDMDNLHTEVQMNSEYVFQAYKKKGKLANIVSQLEELKKQTRSRLVEDCIKNPALCDPESEKPKYTKDKAEAYYRQQSEYIQVIDELMKAEYELTCFEGLQKAFEDRKWLLKDAVALAMSDYFESTETSQTRQVLSKAGAMSMVNEPEIEKVVQAAVCKKEETPEPKTEKAKKTGDPAPKRTRRRS